MYYENGKLQHGDHATQFRLMHHQSFCCTYFLTLGANRSKFVHCVESVYISFVLFSSLFVFVSLMFLLLYFSSFHPLFFRSIFSVRFPLFSFLLLSLSSYFIFIPFSHKIKQNTVLFASWCNCGLCVHMTGSCQWCDCTYLCSADCVAYFSTPVNKSAYVAWSGKHCVVFGRNRPFW